MGERRGDRAVGELAARQLAGRAARRGANHRADELAFNPRDTPQFCTFRGEAGGLADGARHEPGVELAALRHFQRAADDAELRLRDVAARVQLRSAYRS